MNVRFPPEPFNCLVREGKTGDILRRTLGELKPKSIYFTEQIGSRGAMAIVHINDPSQIPSFSEPFYLDFNAECEFRIAMSLEELMKAGLDESTVTERKAFNCEIRSDLIDRC